MNVTDILRCPVSGQRLQLKEAVKDISLISEDGKKSYSIDGRFYDFMPREAPEGLERLWELWTKLQHNGSIGYALAPALNLNTDPEKNAFEGIVKLQGMTLDVGCGPRSDRPGYAESLPDTDYVGLDPIAGERPKNFTFVHSIAEQMPFADGVFANVIFYSTIDHMIDFRLALREAIRVLQPNGQIFVVMDDLDGNINDAGSLSRRLDIVRRGIGQLFKAVSQMGVGKGIAYTWRIANLRIPEGAKDYFHVYFPSPKEISAELKQQGFGLQMSRDYGVEKLLVYARD